MSRYGPHRIADQPTTVTIGHPSATGRRPLSMPERDVLMPRAILRQRAQVNGIAHCGDPDCRHRGKRGPS